MEFKKYLLIEQIQDLLNNISKVYVKKVSGKDLSDNNFDDEYKTKVDNNTLERHNHSNKSILDGILQNKINQWNIAEQNVQSDWNENDEAIDSFIKNKPIRLSEFSNDLNFIDNTVNNLQNYYKKTENYNKTEIDTIINNVITVKLNIQVVDILPTTNISLSTIYLIRKNKSIGSFYDEYINIDGTINGWELIGNTEADFTNYYNKQQIDSFINQLKGISLKNISIPVSSWSGLTYIINNSSITINSTIMISFAFDSIPFAQKANIRFKQETGRIIAYANKLPISTIVIEEIKIINYTG